MKNMEYRLSKDGVDRVTLHLTIRMTRDEMAAIRKMNTTRFTKNTWHKMLCILAGRAIRDELDDENMTLFDDHLETLPEKG